MQWAIKIWGDAGNAVGALQLPQALCKTRTNGSARRGATLFGKLNRKIKNESPVSRGKPQVKGRIHTGLMPRSCRMKEWRGYPGRCSTQPLAGMG